MANGNWWDKYKTGGAAVAPEEEEAEPVAQEGNWWDKYKSTPEPAPEPEAAEVQPVEEAPQANWWDKYKTTASKPEQDPNKELLSNWDKTTQEFEQARKGYEQLGARYQELGAKEARTPEEEQELQTTWNSLLNSGFSVQSAQDKVTELQPQIEKFNERQKKARIDYIEDRRGSGIFGDEAAEALYDIDARADQEYAQARTIEDTDKRKEAMAAIQAKYQAEEKDLTNQYVGRFKENETKINNAADVIGQAFAKGQTVDQFLLETGADTEEFNELRDSLLNQDDPEKGKLFREARAMVDLAEGTNKVGIVNNEIRISPLHVWDAEGIKSEIEALDISDAKKQTAIKGIPQLQQEAAKIEYPWLKENVSEFNSFVKDNNLENVSPERQIAEWKGRNDGWLSNIPKAGVQAGIGLRQQALGFLGAGQTIVGATASVFGAQKFADPFLDEASKTSDEIERLERVSQEIGGPTIVKDLASGALQVGVQIGFGGAVGFGAKRAGFKPKTVSNIGFGSSVGAVMAQSYGGVLSSAIQTLEKEKIDGGMNPTQARAEAIKEAQLPAALSALIEGTVTVLGGKRGSEAPFRDGPDAVKAKLNTPAFKAQLDRFTPNLVGGGAVEGVEELIAQFGQGFVEQATFNPSLSTSDIVNNAFKAFIIGGTLGSGVEGLKYGFDYMNAPKAMARREASMESIRQSIADAEQDISNISASSPIGAEFQREYDATLPSDEAANLGGVAVDRTRMNGLQAERQQLAELLEDQTISKVARNQLEGKLAAADLSYYNEVLAPMRRNVVNEQMVDQLDGMVVSQKTKDGLTAMAKIANGLGAETLTGRERVAVGITSVGGGRFLPSIKNPMVEVNEAGQATVTEAGRLMAENVGMAPLVRMIGLSESTRAKQAEMERVVAEAEARKAQQEAKDTAESEEAKRYGPEAAEALKQQVATQPPAPEAESNVRLAQLLKEQEEAARLGEEAVTRAVETRFIESFRSSISEAIIPTAERAATIDLNAFRDVINSIAQEIDKGTFNIELVEQGEFKNILPEQAFTTVVEAFRENPQRALNALRTFGDEVENAVKEFGGGAAGEPIENLEPLLRVVRTEQTPEDVTALTETGLIEIYKDQPVITEAGLAVIPEAERPRLTPEARKIQIDTGANEVVAEAISKGLRIGVDQVGPNVTMPQGWTLDGDIYVPPSKPVATQAVPTPAELADKEYINPAQLAAQKETPFGTVDPKTQVVDATGRIVPRYMWHSPPSGLKQEQGVVAYVSREAGAQRAIDQSFGGKDVKTVWLGVFGRDKGMRRGAFTIDLAKLDPANIMHTGQAEGNVWYRGDVPEYAIDRTGTPPVQPPVTPPVTPPPVAPTAVAITEEQANNAIKAAQEERARKPAPTIGRTRWGPQSVAPKQSIGKTVREALKTASRLNLSKIAQSDPNEIMMQDVAAILAELDMPILDLEPIKSLASLRKKGRARRWGGVQSVIGLPSTIPIPVEILVHEIGHTITADQVSEYLPRAKFARGKGYLDAINKVVADPKTPEPISRLFSLYVSTIEQLGIADQYFAINGIAGGRSADASKALGQRAQAKGLIRKDIKPLDFYGLANLEEFVSQTFSEPSFRNLLKSLKDPTNPRQSLWQAFVDAIQRILQLPKGSMAAAVIEASVDVGMLVEPARVKARGAAGVTPAPAPEPDMAPEPETSKTVEMSLEMEKERTFQLLGERLYTAELPKVVVKETVQNGFDAIKDAEETGEIPRGSGVISYSRKELEVNGEKIVRMMFSDNGGGMTPEILQNAFFTVGGTFKRSGKGSGGFGLAKLGMFMSADRVMVETVRDGVVTTADLTKQELVDKKFSVNVAEGANRKNGTMVILEFKKSITRSDGKTVEFNNPYTQFDKLIQHNISVIDDSYGTYQEELIKLFQNKPSLYTVEELKSRHPINPYTFESFVKEVPNVETFEQDFVIAGAKKPIKVRVAAARLGYKRKNGKAKWNEEIEIAGVNRTLSNYNMSVYSNGLFQFEQTGLKIDPMKMFGGDPLPYSIVVDIDAGGLDAASLAYPFTNSREDFQNGVVKDYINKLLNDIRVKERQRQFDQEFGLLTDISGGEPRKDSPTLYNNTTIVPEPPEQKFLEDLSKTVFDVADDLVVALRKGYEDKILEDAWYKVKSQKGLAPTLAESNEDTLDYFYGVGISKNWGGVNTSREPVSALVNPIYEERVDEYARTEFGRRILARTIAKTLIHEINHHLHRNEGSDFTFFILQNEAYLGEVGAIQSAVDKILPVVNQHSDAIISLKNKFRTAETKDTDNELTGEQYERSSKEPDGQPRTTVVGGDRLVQQPSTEVSPRPTSEEDGEQTGAYLPSSLTVADRQDAGVGEGISFGDALSGSLVENQAQINEEGISRAEGGVAEAITPQQDRDYLDAVERGDLDAASRMVEEAAKKAGYREKGKHATPAPEFTEFSMERTGKGTDTGFSGRGFYFWKNKVPSWYIENFRPEFRDRVRIVNAYLKLTNPITNLDTVEPVPIGNKEATDAWTDARVAEGYDGVIVGSEVVVFSPEQIKSADPVTRDDQGNIIPLSQRFQPEQADIRYAPEEEFEIIPEQVEDQIDGTPEAATIKVMGQAFQMANEQSAAAGTPQGTLPLETITSAWMNSGRDVETLENAIIRYTNLEPEAASTLAQAIGKQVEIQRGIMEISDAASRRKAEKEKEPEIKPYSFAERIAGELPRDLRNKINLAYEVLRNEVSVEEANRVMSGLTVDEAIRATEDMTNGVSFPVRSMMAQIVLRKIMAQRKSTKGKKGKEADYKAAVEAHVKFLDFTNDYFKELGQGVQAIARFSDLGADGVLLKIRRDVDKAISKHIKNRRGQIDQIKRDVEDADNAAFDAAVKANKSNIDKTAKKAGEQEAKKLTIEEQAQKLAIRAAKKVTGEEVRRRQPDPLSDLVNNHLRRYNANFIAEATAMGVSPVTAQAIEDSAKKLRDSRQATKSERERFKEMQDERMRVKKELARENKYIYGPRPTIWENYQDMFSERLARRLMRDPKKKVPPSLLLFTDRLTENLLGFVPEAERQATTQRSFQAMVEDALNNKEKYQEAFNRALEDISLKVMELEVREAAGEKISSATYKKAVAAQEFLERLEPIIQQFPVSDKLIMRFVNQKMKAMGESLVGKYNDWYRSSRKTRIEIEKALAEKLVADMNVSNADAVNLSRAIVKDFRAKAEERREKALARFKKPKEKTKRLAESPLKKFFELVNIGALTDQDAYEVMAHRFELPTWDEKFAKQIEEMALIIQDMPEGMERRRLTRNMMAEIARRKGFSLSDLGSGFFYSNMLSSVETFLINFYDTLLGNWINGLASSVADKDFARFNGLVAGYRKGWMEAVQVFRTGLRINMPRLEEKTPLTVELINYGRKGGVALESTEGMNAIAKTILESPPAKVLNLWKYVTRIMEATDALNYTASSEGQRYAEAAKIAKDEGLEGKAKQKRINQILNLGDDVYQAALKQAEQEGYTGNDAKFRAMEIQDNEIDAELREKSFDRALTDVYRNMPTGLAGATAAQFNNYVMKIANPWFRNAFKLFTAPFVITPTNLFNRWLDYSPYGYKRLFYGSGNLLDKDTPYYVAPPKVGSAEFYTQALKASSSVIVMGIAAGLIKAGLLVLRGMGPSDEEERKQWLADGNRPHTFSFMGGPQISYQFTPWALVLSWMANYSNWEQYNAKDDASGGERIAVAMTAATSVIMDLPFFAGPAEFMEAVQSKKGDPIATPLKYLEGKMGMVYPNLVRQIDRFFDPTLYDSQGLKGLLIDQMPFARRLGTQRVNLFGDPIGEDKPTMDRLVGRIMSFPPKPSRESRILAKYDIYPYMPSPKEAKALVDGERAQMTEEQYNKFVQLVGKDVKKRINDLFDPEGEITEKERERGKKRISQIFERARARAVREVSTY